MVGGGEEEETLEDATRVRICGKFWNLETVARKSVTSTSIHMEANTTCTINLSYGAL
jgi:hypothetical protein